MTMVIYEIHRLYNRPKLHTEQPVVLYLTPPNDIADYESQPGCILLEKLKADVAEYNIFTQIY